MLTRAHDRSIFFFFNDTATTEIYTLSLHDALPISGTPGPVYIEYPAQVIQEELDVGPALPPSAYRLVNQTRSEEHTSELQSHLNLVCRLLLEKKKNTTDDSYAHVCVVATCDTLRGT